MEGKLPWPHNSEDMQHFRQTTMGGIVVVGRKTWEGLPSQGLPGRRVLVLSRSSTWTPSWGEKASYGAVVASQEENIWIAGGTEVYRLFLPHVEEIHRTLIFGSHQTDRSFLIPEDFRLVACRPTSACSFQVWKREKTA